MRRRPCAAHPCDCPALSQDRPFCHTHWWMLPREIQRRVSDAAELRDEWLRDATLASAVRSACRKLDEVADAGGPSA